MEEDKFLFSNCILVKNQLFFVDTQSGLPAMMDPDSGDVTYSALFQDYIWRDGNSIDFMWEFDGNVYALETAGDALVIFDLHKQRCSYIPLNCSYREWGNFVAFEKYGSDFYIFPKYGNKIFTFSAGDRKVAQIAGKLGEMEEIQCARREGSKVWLISRKGSAIYAYDLSDNSWRIYRLNAVIKDCTNCILVGESIYLLNIFGIIYKWNIGDGEIQEIRTLETRHLEAETMYSMVHAGNCLIVLPSLGADIKILDLLTGKMEIYHDYPADFNYYDIGWSKYYGYCEDGKYYYFAMRRGNYFLKICKKNGKLSWIKPVIVNDRKKSKLLVTYKINRYLQEEEKVINEEEGYLSDWLKYLPVSGNVRNNRPDSGKIIYEKERGY